MIPIGLRAALRFLTILPVPWDEREAAIDGRRSVLWFPLVGLLLGAVVAAVIVLPIAPLPRAACALIAWIVLTGALHEDGVMDCADAALAPVGAERRAEIRKDPRAGSFAVCTEGLLLIARFAALTAVPPVAALITPVLGRTSMCCTLALHEGAAGSSTRFRGGGRLPLLFAGAIVIMVATLSRDLRVIMATALSMAAGLATARWLVHRLGSASGDVHGAAAVIAETAALYVFVGGA